MEYIWLVEQWREEKEAPELQGIFSAKEKAVAACVLDTFCVTRVPLDEALPVETVPRVHCWYPLRESEPED